MDDLRGSCTPSPPWRVRTGLGLVLLVGASGCVEPADAEPSSGSTSGEVSTTEQTPLGDTTEFGTTEWVDGSSTAAGETENVDDGTETGETGEPVPYRPERYPGGRAHSPVTPYVADRMREIAVLGPDKADDVFMKTGASSTVSSNTLHCFADDPLELGAHDHLLPTLEWFLGGDAAGSTPFDRDTLAAEVGHHAGWAIEGDPSPVEMELELVSPQLALIHFGTNDMGWGATYGDALVGFHTNMMLLMDMLHDEGIVPIVFGITRRGDLASAQRWVGTWNAALRAMAQARQIPFVDLYHAIDPLAEHGLAGDGLHLEAFAGGACVLTESGLEHGYNQRNLLALEALDRSAAVLVDDADGLDEPAPTLSGAGTQGDPWVIDQLPFGDARNTELEGDGFVDVYSACSTSDESGPELWYRLEVDTTTRIRAVVLDMEGVDIDVHLVDETATGEGCIERGHHFVQTTLSPGTYHFALDTWVSDGTPLAGDFVFVLVECDDDDSACDP